MQFITFCAANQYQSPCELIPIAVVCCDKDRMKNVILLIDRRLVRRWNFCHFPIIVVEFYFEENVYVKKWASFLIGGHADFADRRR